MFECAIVGEMKEDQDGHDFAHVHGPLAMGSSMIASFAGTSFAGGQSGSFGALWQLVRKLRGVVVEIPKECDDIHGGLRAVKPCLPDTYKGFHQPKPPLLCKRITPNSR